MSDLTDARDHARKMAAWTDPRDTAGLLNAYCDELRIGPSIIAPAHDRCWSDVCNCPCHPRDPGPTPAERALWTQIADEIDAYLSGPDDEPLEGM